ncbi:MAG: N-acetylmuramoyl-L-alanine amidase, partial [Clostridia bacterium]
MKIFIDPGHNYTGADTGAAGNNLREQDITFYIAKKLETLFLQNGDQVKMSRNRLTDSLGNSVQESITGRVVMANDWGADLCISLHCNAGGGTGT